MESSMESTPDFIAAQSPPGPPAAPSRGGPTAAGGGGPPTWKTERRCSLHRVKMRGFHRQKTVISPAKIGDFARKNGDFA